MKKKNRIAKILLSIALIFPGLNVSALENSKTIINNNGVKINQNQINNLKSLGFTDNQIDNMDNEEFQLNKNLSGQIISTDTKYIKSTYVYRAKNNKKVTSEELENYISNNKNLSDNENLEFVRVENEEITELEYNNVDENDNHIYITRDQNPNVYETSYKKLTTSITLLSNGRYRMRNDLHWKIMPSNRSYDISGIGLNSATAEPVSGTHYAKQTYTTKDSCTLVVSQTQEFYNSVSYWQRGASGYGVNFLLPSNTTKTYYWNELLGTHYPCATGNNNNPSGSVTATINVTAIDSYMYFEVAKVGITSPLSAFGSYQHSVTSLSWTISHSFTVGLNGNLGYSINVQPSYVTYYDGMSGTHAQILNPSW